MTWGPYNSPWGYGPQGPTPPVVHVPVPVGTDIERVLQLVDRLEKRKAKKEEKKKKEDDAKKKTKQPEAPKVSVLTVFLLMMTFGLPVGAFNLWLMQLAAENVKLLLK